MSIEQRVKKVFEDVLDIKPQEIKPEDKLENGLGIDSTEMVELCVAIKKEFRLDGMANNDLKKQHTFNQIVDIIKSKGASA